MKNVVLGSIAIVMITGFFILTNVQKQQDCENRAQAAAINEYPVNEYPDTNERSRLQETYKVTYMETCG